MGPVLDEVMQSTEALLFGRRTWQTMAGAWPGRAGWQPRRRALSSTAARPGPERVESVSSVSSDERDQR